MYKRILIATDGSDKSKLAAKEGLELAKALGAQAVALYAVNEVVVASAVKQLGADRKDVEAKLHKAGEKALDEIKQIGSDVGVSVETLIRSGAPANVIIDVARTENTDLIIMGSHGESGVSKLLIGSVVQKVLYWATVPVLVVR